MQRALPGHIKQKEYNVLTMAVKNNSKSHMIHMILLKNRQKIVT